MSAIRLPEAFTEAKAAELLTAAGWDISERTLRRAREKGEIAFRMIGGKVRYTEADLLDYLERGRRCEAKGETTNPGSSFKGTGSDASQEPNPGTTAGTRLESARSVGDLCMNAITSGQRSPSSAG